MNPGIPPNSSTSGQSSAAGLNLDDVIYTLFRHKWMLLGFICLGALGAFAVRLVRPPLYVSKAKLMVRYIPDAKGGGTSEAPIVVDTSPFAIISSEIEILTSADVAAQAAINVGSEKILARKGGGSDPQAAMGVICSGTEVDPPRSAIISVSFKHPDKEVVQPVLQALIQAYERKHLDIHTGGDRFDAYLMHQRDEWRKKLEETEEKLKRLRSQIGGVSLDDAKKALQKQIDKVSSELLETTLEPAVPEAQLDGNWAASGQAQGAANSLGGIVPAKKMGEYSSLTSELEDLKKRERDLLLTFKEAHPSVQTVRARIKKLSEQIAELERLYPMLVQVALGNSHGTNNVGGMDVATVMRLEARSKRLGLSLSNLQAEQRRLSDMEPTMRQLERQRDEEERTYQFILLRIDRRQMGETSMSGNMINLSVVQNPTPPAVDLKKMLKLVGLALAGCIGIGLGLAFLIDLFLDRSLKRTIDVERHLRLPVFLTIPDTSWTRRFCSLWRASHHNGQTGKTVQGPAVGISPGESVLAPWSPDHDLQTYAEGLRERILTYFEVRNLNLKKPKLVAVTGCGKGAGVSTLAGGLAAALSKTGDGSVLLVDMNVDQGTAQSFYKGNPSCALTDVLEPEQRADAQVQENLYLATINSSKNEPLAKVLPTRFAHLMPKLKASDYDYIIFDMPPVSQTSTTPRLAGYMDLVLLVLESEKTGQQMAKRATGLMRESRANVAAVLNKYRSYVPAPLSQEL